MKKEFKTFLIGFIIGIITVFFMNFLETGCSPWDPRCNMRTTRGSPFDPVNITLE